MQQNENRSELQQRLDAELRAKAAAKAKQDGGEAGGAYDRPDGVESNEVSDTSVVVIEGGALFGEQWEYEGPSLETYFRRWRKKQTTTFLTVECDHTKLEAVKAAIKAAGGKISK